MKRKQKPLGYLELPDKIKPIWHMTDAFLNYTFEDPENWDSLRNIGNIVIEAYKSIAPETMLKPVTGQIGVRTQFEQFLHKAKNAAGQEEVNSTKKDTSKNQDLRMDELGKGITFFEFQIRPKSDVPIEDRSVGYFALGIGHGDGRPSNQIWFIAGDVEEIFHGKTFVRYVLKEETGTIDRPLRGDSGILYVNLKQLAGEDGPAGELAALLLGIELVPKSEIVREIAQAFETSIGKFTADRRVVDMMSILERYVAEGRMEGREEGREEERQKIAAIMAKKDAEMVAVMAELAALKAERGMVTS